MSEVNHPHHYTTHPSGVECIEITEHLNFCLGNAVKYIWRAGLKSPDADKDLAKAVWYLERERARLVRLAAISDAAGLIVDEPVVVRKPIGYGVFLAKYPDDRSEGLPDLYATERAAQDAIDNHPFSEQYFVQPVMEDVDTEEPRERPHDIVSLDDEESEC